VLEKLRRPNWLRELQIVIIVGLVLLGLGFTMTVIGILTGKPDVENTAQPEPILLALQGDQPQPFTVRLIEPKFMEPTAPQIGWYLASTLPSLLALVMILLLLLRVVHRARNTDPFTTSTVRDLRWIAAITLVGGVLSSFAEALANFALSSSISSSSPATTVLTLPTVWIFGGFVCFAFAEVVKRGCVLRDELAEVI
jgi:hypothetical protein